MAHLYSIKDLQYLHRTLLQIPCPQLLKIEKSEVFTFEYFA